MGALWIVVFAISTSCHLPHRFDRAAQQSDRGESVYRANCALCHGGYGYDNRAPDLFLSTVLNRDVNGKLLGQIARAGRPALGMPAFSNLTSAQITDLAAFLHARSSELKSYGPGIDQFVTGDPKQGKAYFAAACSGCHSPTGDLAGIATSLNAGELQHRLLYPGQGAAMRSAIVTMPDGRTIEGSVVHDDEFSISIRRKDGWYQSWPRSSVKVEIHDPLAGHLALLDKYTNQDIHNLFAYLASLK